MGNYYVVLEREYDYNQLESWKNYYYYGQTKQYFDKAEYKKSGKVKWKVKDKKKFNSNNKYWK